ncbi:extracellular solute-binding protein [Candidatus Aerophobetes bacterium]|nr:extracellular solute-binding protein [Candidatus Aerophobetes bacterium]
MRKKAVGVVILVCLLMMLVVGNVFAWNLRDASAPYRGKTIRVSAMAGYEWNELTAKIAPIFEAITGIKVVFDFVTYGEIVEKHMIELASGTNVHDLYDVDTPYLAQHVSFMVPIDSFMKNSKLADPEMKMEDFYQGALDGLKYEEKLYSFPQMYCFPALFYRTDLFEEYGIAAAPKTSEEYYQIAKKLTLDLNGDGKPEIYGTTISGSRTGIGDEIYTRFWGMGASLFDDYMRPTFKKGGVYYDKMVQVLRHYQKLYTEGYAPPGSTDYEIGEVTGAFSSGLTAMAWNWSICGAQFADPARSPKIYGKWAAALLPRDNPQVKKWHRQGLKGMMINKFSPKDIQEAAYLFIQWNSSPLMSYVLAKMGDTTPFRRSILESPALKDMYPHWSIHREVFQNGYDRLVPYIPEWSECEDIMARPFQSCMIGKMTPEEAADRAAKDLEEMLKVKGYYEAGKKYRSADGTYPVWLTGNY